MSSSIAIPKRKQPVRNEGASYGSASSSYSNPSPSSSSNAASPSTSGTVAQSASPARSADRRPSLLGSSLSKSEYTVINLAHSDGPPRLVTCVKSSQGFDWNQELFLPSYADYESSDLERKQDPVQDIILTDEEAASILPQ